MGEINIWRQHVTRCHVYCGALRDEPNVFQDIPL